MGGKSIEDQQFSPEWSFPRLRGRGSIEAGITVRLLSDLLPHCGGCWYGSCI